MEEGPGGEGGEDLGEAPTVSIKWDLLNFKKIPEFVFYAFCFAYDGQRFPTPVTVICYNLCGGIAHKSDVVMLYFEVFLVNLNIFIKYKLCFTNTIRYMQVAF